MEYLEKKRQMEESDDDQANDDSENQQTEAKALVDQQVDNLRLTLQRLVSESPKKLGTFKRAQILKDMT